MDGRFTRDLYTVAGVEEILAARVLIKGYAKSASGWCGKGGARRCCLITVCAALLAVFT